MRFAFADPPYLGCGASRYGAHHPDAADCDDPAWHAALIGRLCADYPDGWALCLHVPSLRTMLNLCPDDVRVGVWLKTFASFKPNVNPAYAWEPVIWRGGRKRGRDMPTARDWVAEPIAMMRGMPGAKPRAFCMWALDLLNVEPGDTVDDLFPGSGAVTAAISERLRHEPPPAGADRMSVSSVSTPVSVRYYMRKTKDRIREDIGWLAIAAKENPRVADDMSKYDLAREALRLHALLPDEPLWWDRALALGERP